MSQTGARQEVENFYFLINQWKETRSLIENQLYTALSPVDSNKLIQGLDKMEGKCCSHLCDV